MPGTIRREIKFIVWVYAPDAIAAIALFGLFWAGCVATF